MRLYDLAAARTGDKGDTSDITVLAYRATDYPHLVQNLTAARVREHFDDIVRGDVTRFELPGLLALKFVLHSCLGGGVTRTLNLDRHGKTLGYSLLEIELPDADATIGDHA